MSPVILSYQLAFPGQKGRRTAQWARIFHFASKLLSCFWGKSNLKIMNVCPNNGSFSTGIIDSCKKAIHFSANEN